MYKKEKMIKTIMEIENGDWVSFVLDEYSFSLMNRAKEYSVSFEYVAEKEVEGIMYYAIEFETGDQRMYYIEDGRKMFLQSIIEDDKEKLMLIEVIERKYIRKEKIPIEKIKIFLEIFE